MSINNDDKSNFIGIYVKEGNQLKEVKKGCVIINGQIKYFYGIKNKYIAPGYIELPYIINNKDTNGYNKAYINTGVEMTSTTRIKFEFSPTRNLDYTVNLQEHVVMYINEKYYLSYKFVINNQKMRLTLKNSSSPDNYYDFDKNTRIICDYNMKINNNLHQTTTSITHSKIPYNWDNIVGTNNYIYLLGAPASSTLFSLQYPNTKLYSCTIYNDIEGNEILREFVPAEEESSGLLGLYDKKNNQFYPNTIYSETLINFVLDDNDSSNMCENLDYETCGYCPTNCGTQCSPHSQCSCDGVCGRDGVPCYTCGDNAPPWCTPWYIEDCPRDCPTWGGSGCPDCPPWDSSSECPTNTNDCPQDDDDCPTDGSSSSCGCFRDCSPQSGKVFAKPSYGEYTSSDNDHRGQTGWYCKLVSGSQNSYENAGGNTFVPWGWYTQIGNFYGGYAYPVISFNGSTVYITDYNYDGSGCS